MSRPTAADYARAEQMLAPYRLRSVEGGPVDPQWYADGSGFWFSRGGRFTAVDPAAGTRADAFDHERLASALSAAAGIDVDASALPVSALERTGGGSLSFTAFGARWQWDGATCTPAEDPLPGPLEIASPDGAWTAFGRGGDIWVRDRGGAEFRLTRDGAPEHPYGQLPDYMGSRALMRALGLGPAFIAEWSPDSTRLLAARVDQSAVPEQVLVESAPAGGGRPAAHRYRVPMPGDADQPTLRWYVIDVAAGTAAAQQGEPAVFLHPSAVVYAWWSGPGGEAVHFLHHSRDGRTLELRSLDPATGAVATLLSETGTTRVDPAPQLGDHPAIARVLGSGEILWWSQRDGWGHLELHPPGGGPAIALTSGPWQVRRVLRLDEEQRRVWFTAAGAGGGDPYLRQIYRVDLDGTGLTRLTDDSLDHDTVAPPRGAYLVDRASGPGTPHRSRVLDLDGATLAELAAPGTGQLEELGWQPPERFRATAADGVTPIYGLLWRPHGFDPERSYPVIDHVYPGPQIHRAGPAFDAPHHGEPEALAALGFAVVAVDGRGTAGRSKEFHDHSYGDLGNAGALDDHIAAIRELGARHPWLDTGRVGITGQSAGGYAAARALLLYPDFYRVGVALAGSHDLGINVPLWAEHYQGGTGSEELRDISNPALAHRLEGRLLLVHGELDDTVLPAQTLRLVDSLIAADKDVDLLLVPGAEHYFLGRGHYVLRRTWDYFVRHLHGAEPPAFQLAPFPLPGA
ncbi:S9 family peptidase [Nocardiopsis coralliicola]